MSLIISSVSEVRRRADVDKYNRFFGRPRSNTFKIYAAHMCLTAIKVERSNLYVVSENE